MNNSQPLAVKEQQRYNEISDLALTNIEVFRRKAEAALKQFTTIEQRTFKQLGATTTSPYDFLVELELTLIPLRQSLDSKRSNTPYKKSLAKQIILPLDTIQPVVDLTINYSDNFHIDSFIRAASGSSGNQTWLKEFITMTSKADVSVLKDHYVDAQLYTQVAHENAITIVNPHASAIKRSAAKHRIARERRNTTAFEDTRLQYIAARRLELNEVYDGLIASIMAEDWNLMEVLAMRQEYEKKLSSLPIDDVLDDSRRLELFDTITNAFKKKHAHRTTTTGLESARQSNAAIDTLLLRIFDLTTAQKNKLLLDSKEYRSIHEEESLIIQTRATRRNELK